MVEEEAGIRVAVPARCTFTQAAARVRNRSRAIVGNVTCGQSSRPASILHTPKFPAVPRHSLLPHKAACFAEGPVVPQLGQSPARLEETREKGRPSVLLPAGSLA
jgi:hypothetical protein